MSVGWLSLADKSHHCSLGKSWQRVQKVCLFFSFLGAACDCGLSSIISRRF